jgi:hypothetical protein
MNNEMQARGGTKARLCAAGAILLLALPLSLGWHPTPTLGSLAEVFAVACALTLLALVPAPANIDLRRLLIGTGGILLLLLGRCLLQPVLSDSAYAGFWVGPGAALAAAFLVAIYWQQDRQDWLRNIAIAVLVAALFNALVGFLQFWRIAPVFDLLGPHLLYWDRGDSIPHGNIAQRNLLATLCLLGIAASLYLHPQRPARAIALEAFLAYMVATTASRTPLAILLAIFLMALVRTRGWRGLTGTPVGWFLATVAIAQVLVPFLNNLQIEMLGLVQPESAIERLSPSGLGTRPIYYRQPSSACSHGHGDWAGKCCPLPWSGRDMCSRPGGSMNCLPMPITSCCTSGSKTACPSRSSPVSIRSGYCSKKEHKARREISRGYRSRYWSSIPGWNSPSGNRPCCCCSSPCCAFWNRVGAIGGNPACQRARCCAARPLWWPCWPS